VVECGDATEVETVLDATAEVAGPVYIRMLRGEIPRLFASDQPMRLGEARHLSSGHDLVLVTAGICTEEAMRATSVLRERGVAIDHFHIATLKPFQAASILEAAAQSKYGVVTMENHSVIGGLGSAVAEAMAEAGSGKRLYRLGLQDRFAHGASRPYLMREYGLDAMALVEQVEAMVGTKFKIEETDLAMVRLEAVHSLAKAEGL
jgi:transketolase